MQNVSIQRISGLQPQVHFRAAQMNFSSSLRTAMPPLVARANTRPQISNVVVSAASVDSPEGVAHLRFQRGSPLKVRRVLDQIRGRSYEEALMILEYMPYKACEMIIKALLSAAANAKHNLGLKKKDLYVSECYANEGPVLKRFRPRAQGRAAKILKPTVHITIKVAEKED